MQTTKQQRQLVRQQMRLQRKALGPEVLYQNGLKICQQAQQLQWPSDQSVALFLSHDGEPDTQPLIQWLWQQQVQVCLPVLHPFVANHLLFLDFRPDSEMVLNKYGIAEPVLAMPDVVPLALIGRVLMPLTAFDAWGHRLGMGAGYYDRTLAPCTYRSHNPQLIGIAHDIQQVEKVPVEPWDMPLEGILTPTRFVQPCLT